MLTYFTGKPCKHGHIAPRRKSNRECTECASIYMKAYSARRYQENIERERAYRREHYQNNTEAYKANAARQRSEGYQEQWYASNRQHWNGLCAKRRAAKLQRTPPWSETEAIQQFYRNCPAGMTVDHIIPLQGELVSGLHVLKNLQYLTHSANSKKSNIFNSELFPEQAIC